VIAPRLGGAEALYAAVALGPRCANANGWSPIRDRSAPRMRIHDSTPRLYAGGCATSSRSSYPGGRARRFAPRRVIARPSRSCTRRWSPTWRSIHRRPTTSRRSQRMLAQGPALLRRDAWPTTTAARALRTPAFQRAPQSRCRRSRSAAADECRTSARRCSRRCGRSITAGYYCRRTRKFTGGGRHFLSPPEVAPRALHSPARRLAVPQHAR